MRHKKKICCLASVIVVACIASSLGGCQTDRICSPSDFDRHGEYFFLTKNYDNSSIRFAMWGKRLCHQDDGKFVILPSPTVIFPGLPLFLIENYLICPAIDLCLLPSDWWRNLGSDDPETIRTNGCYVQVMDIYGRPVPGVEVRAWAANDNCKPVFYKGARQREFRARGLTDANGELFVPIDMTTVQNRVNVCTAGRCEGHDLVQCYYDQRSRHPPFKNGIQYSTLPFAYWNVKRKDIVDPNEFFPKREHLVRVVLEPEGETKADGHYTGRWKFIPAKESKIERASARWWQIEDAKTYDSLTNGLEVKAYNY